jgi:beta-lactamase regulating signal transducer with metallopeptidase domain
MSLTGAFVIAAICLARPALKKAPKIISYSLWAVAGFRLVFPFSVESVFSLIPFKAQSIPMDVNLQSVSLIDSGIPIVDNAVNGAASYFVPVYAIHRFQLMWTDIGAWVWVIGAALMALYGVASYLRLKRKMASAIRVEGNIYETNAVTSPFVLGVFKPKIYLPLDLSGQERNYIILHEQTHIKRKDHIVKFAAYFILCLHWFNPLAWVAFLLMGVDMEMSCDERVLKEMGGETKKDYSLSLLALNSRPPAGTLGPAARWPLAFSEGGLKGRIKNVLNFKKSSRVIVIAAIALAAVLSVGFALNRAEPEPVEPSDSLGTPYYDEPETFATDVDTITVYMFKSNGQTGFALFNWEVTFDPAVLSSSTRFGDVVGLNAALAEYQQDTISHVLVKHTSDFTKDEVIALMEMFVIPSANYGMSTGLAEWPEPASVLPPPNPQELPPAVR